MIPALLILAVVFAVVTAGKIPPVARPASKLAAGVLRYHVRFSHHDPQTGESHDLEQSQTDDLPTAMRSYLDTLAQLRTSGAHGERAYVLDMQGPTTLTEEQV